VWHRDSPRAHSQGETIDELNANLAEVIEMLLEDGEPAMESEFIGTQTVQVGRAVAKRKLPILKPAEVVTKLVALGFEEIRQKRSHKQFRHAGGCTVVAVESL